jgi:Leucine-rich repeat (LRR) protein
LQHCKNLQALSLTDCDIEDFRPLENFKKLRILEIRFVQARIRNIETINALQELEYLHLEAQDVNSIGDVNNPSIRFLNLSNSNLFEIQQISPNPKLRLLDVSGTQIRTLSGIEQFTNLEVLVIGDIDVDEYGGLVSLQKLRYLIIHNVKSDSKQEAKLIKLQISLPKVKFIDTAYFVIPGVYYYKGYGGNFGSRKIEMFKSLDAALDRELEWVEEQYLWRRE